MSAWLVGTLVATTLLMTAVLAVRTPIRRCFGASAAYGLWLAPALRFLLPPLELFPAAPAPAAAAGRAVGMVVGATDAATAATGTLLLSVWAVGAVMFWTWHAIAYASFMQRALAGAELRTTGSLMVLRTDQVAGPAAAGLLTRTILVPADFDTRFTAAERTLALRHERVHLSRGDLWANALALWMLGLHWFNPIAHCAYRAFREDQELSCDAAVIADTGPEERAAYGAAMVKSAWRGAPSTLCPMTRTTNLKRRLTMLCSHKNSAIALAAGKVTVGLMAAGGLALTATGSIAAEQAAKGTTVIVKRVEGASDPNIVNAEAKARCGVEATRSLTEALSQQMGKPVRVKLVNCTGGERSAAQRLATTERARAGVLESKQLSEAERNKVVAALDAEIAKLKAEQ